MARERDFPASRNRNVENATSWILALLAMGVLAALLVVAVVPADVADEPGVTEHVVPNTAPPVRVE
jgi:hypothetical protein